MPLSSLPTPPKPMPWDPKKFPVGMKYPPGLCLWPDTVPDDILITVDEEVVYGVEKAQLGPFGSVICRAPTDRPSLRTRTGLVEAWRQTPALPAPKSSDTLVA